MTEILINSTSVKLKKVIDLDFREKNEEKLGRRRGTEPQIRRKIIPESLVRIDIPSY